MPSLRSLEGQRPKKSMEKTWELTVVMKYLSEPSIDGFVIEHEFILSFHLQQIENAIDQFDVAYAYLRDLKDNTEISGTERNQIWDRISDIGNAIFRIVQTLVPTVARKRGKQQKELTRKRGEILRQLMKLSEEDAKSLNDMRNRFVHFDEDIDDWFYKQRIAGVNSGDLKVISKLIFMNETILHQGDTATMLCYDISGGTVHSFGKIFSIHDFHRTIKIVSDSLVDARKLIQNMCGDITKVTTL